MKLKFEKVYTYFGYDIERASVPPHKIYRVNWELFEGQLFTAENEARLIIEQQVAKELEASQ